MSGDIDVLRFFMEQKYFQSTRKVYPDEMFDSAEIVAFLKWFEFYFKTYREDKFVDVDKLSTLMKLDKGVDKDSFKLSKLILQQLRTPIDPTVRATLLETLEERRLAGEIGILQTKYSNGLEVDFTAEVLKLAQDSHKRRRITYDAAWEDGDVYEMAKAEADTSGYFFTFLPKEFYNCFRGLNEGDNMGVAAPTNQGKTSFLSAIAVCFAQQRAAKFTEYQDLCKSPEFEQVEGHTLSRFRPVLYLINEGSSKKITPRIYQTALKCDRAKFLDYGKEGTLNERYVKIMGRRDAIRCVNVHGLNIAAVIKIIEAHDPFLVITDMTGRIKDYNATGANDVPQLENVWNTLREQAEVLDFLHVGTVQISAEGENMYYPPRTALQQSKTGIQTTWDFSIYIGYEDKGSPAYSKWRGLSTPKSKRAKQGFNDEQKILVVFDPELNTWDGATS